MNHPPVLVLPSYLRPDECAEILALYPPTLNSAKVSVADGNKHVDGDRPEYRKSSVTFIERDLATAPESLFRRLGQLVVESNEKVFGFTIQGSESFQLTEYDVGGEYQWHLDIGPGNAALRKISVSAQLSNETEYEGGELELQNGGLQPLVADKTIGTAILFPSYLLHRVLPVTKGKRRALVAWITGPKFK